jgi:4-hydroxybenzoate polyprenyltransferase
MQLTRVLCAQICRASVIYHINTIFLFTKSDMKTTVYPATTFALASALSGPLLTTNSTPTASYVLSQLPKAFLWTWLNLLLFNLGNQRLPTSILEDSINKPWRAIPSKRLTPTQARQLLLICIPAVLLGSLYLGGRDEAVALMVLNWIYNDLGAGDENFVVRHAVNALGFVSFSAGATQVICGYPQHTLNGTAYQWLGMVAAVIAFTIQFQDMEDHEGDRMRNRRTMRIVLGDTRARWVNAVTIIASSLVATAFWQPCLVVYLVPVLFGVGIASRTLLLKSLGADKLTFKLWCLWLMVLYLLPFLSVTSICSGFDLI